MAKLRCTASGGGGGAVLVDLYSAAADVVTVSFGNNTYTYTTDSNGHVSAILPTGAVTFTSSIAKDPSDPSLSAAYSKTVNISNNTTEVYVMPDNVLYWYGYQSGNLEVCSTTNGWGAGSGYSFVNPTFNANNISLAAAASRRVGVGTKNMITSSTIKFIAKGVTANAGTYAEAISPISTKDLSAISGFSYLDADSTSDKYYSFSYTSAVGYMIMQSHNNRSSILYALWYE